MIERRCRILALMAAVAAVSSCRTSGTAWMNEPISAAADDITPRGDAAPLASASRARP